MIKKDEKLPVLSTSNSSGITDIMQLVDMTPNEIFTIIDTDTAASRERE